MTTLDEAREFLRKHIAEGVICPCCNRFTKRYRRKFNSGMAQSLIAIHNWFLLNPVPWVKITQDISMPMIVFAEYSKLRFWGLLEASTETSGEWRITEKGKLFAQGELKVQKYVYVLNNELLGMDGEDVTISDCLGDDFDLKELLSI